MGDKRPRNCGLSSPSSPRLSNTRLSLRSTPLSSRIRLPIQHAASRQVPPHHRRFFHSHFPFSDSHYRHTRHQCFPDADATSDSLQPKPTAAVKKPSVPSHPATSGYHTGYGGLEARASVRGSAVVSTHLCLNSLVH